MGREELVRVSQKSGELHHTQCVYSQAPKAVLVNVTTRFSSLARDQ